MLDEGHGSALRSGRIWITSAPDRCLALRAPRELLPKLEAHQNETGDEQILVVDSISHRRERCFVQTGQQLTV
jgi:hypothetical protein